MKIAIITIHTILALVTGSWFLGIPLSIVRLTFTHNFPFIVILISASLVISMALIIVSVLTSWIGIQKKERLPLLLQILIFAAIPAYMFLGYVYLNAKPVVTSSPVSPTAQITP